MTEIVKVLIHHGPSIVMVHPVDYRPGKPDTWYFDQAVPFIKQEGIEWTHYSIQYPNGAKQETIYDLGNG